jgi:hypothetical protein
MKIMEFHAAGSLGSGDYQTVDSDNAFNGEIVDCQRGYLTF